MYDNSPDNIHNIWLEGWNPLSDAYDGYRQTLEIIEGLQSQRPRTQEAYEANGSSSYEPGNEPYNEGRIRVVSYDSGFFDQADNSPSSQYGHPPAYGNSTTGFANQRYYQTVSAGYDRRYGQADPNGFFRYVSAKGAIKMLDF